MQSCFLKLGSGSGTTCHFWTLLGISSKGSEGLRRSIDWSISSCPIGTPALTAQVFLECRPDQFYTPEERWYINCTEFKHDTEESQCCWWSNFPSWTKSVQRQGAYIIRAAIFNQIRGITIINVLKVGLRMWNTITRVVPIEGDRREEAKRIIFFQAHLMQTGSFPKCYWLLDRSFWLCKKALIRHVLTWARISLYTLCSHSIKIFPWCDFMIMPVYCLQHRRLNSSSVALSFASFACAVQISGKHSFMCLHSPQRPPP